MEVLKLIKKPIGHTKIEYYVTVDGQTVSDAMDIAIDNMVSATYTVVPDGDDPEKTLRDKLGDQQFESMLQFYVTSRLFPFIISDEPELDMAFDPNCTSEQIPRRGEDFQFTIHVLLRPKYSLTSYDPVEVEVRRYTVPEEAIDKQLAQIAEINTGYKTLEDDGSPIEMGQFIQIDMHTTKDGREVRGLCGEGRLLELNYGFMPKGFIDNIVGMTVGQTKTFDFEGPREGTIDEDDTEIYTCTLTVTERKRQMVPEITDAWVEVNMPDAGTLEGLREKIREGLEEQNNQQTQQEISQAVDFELSKRFEGKIPDEIYETAGKSVYQTMVANLRQQGKTIDDIMQEEGVTQDQINMQVMLQARDIIRQGLSLDKLFEVKIGELSDQDIDEAFKAIAPGREEEAKEQFHESGRDYAIKEVAKRLAAHRWLVENAIITYRDVEMPIPSDPYEQQA